MSSRHWRSSVFTTAFLGATQFCGDSNWDILAPIEIFNSIVKQRGLTGRKHLQMALFQSLNMRLPDASHVDIPRGLRGHGSSFTPTLNAHSCSVCRQRIKGLRHALDAVQDPGAVGKFKPPAEAGLELVGVPPHELQPQPLPPLVLACNSAIVQHRCYNCM